MLTQARQQGGAFPSTFIGPLLTTMIQGLISDGVWSKLDRLWIFAQDTQVNALTDLVTGAAAINHGGAFVPFAGFSGVTNSSTVYIDSGFNPATAGGHYSLNSAHMSVYDRTAVGDQNHQIGIADGTGIASMSIATGVTFGFLGFINDASNLNPSPITPAGMFIITRTGSTARAEYNNGSSVGSDTQVSTNIPTSGNIFILGENISGSAGNGSSDQLAAASIGGGLTATDAANLSSRINTYMRAIGAAVY